MTIELVDTDISNEGVTPCPIADVQVCVLVFFFTAAPPKIEPGIFLHCHPKIEGEPGTFYTVIYKFYKVT